MVITVICAWPDRVWQRRLELLPGSTVADALTASHWQDEIPELGSAPLVGVFGQPVPASHVLNPHDRVELYRPLLADPKTSRRSRAAGRA